MKEVIVCTILHKYSEESHRKQHVWKVFVNLIELYRDSAVIFKNEIPIVHHGRVLLRQLRRYFEEK